MTCQNKKDATIIVTSKYFFQLVILAAFNMESYPVKGEVKYVCFWTPLTLTEDFRKIDRGPFYKKARRRRKIFGIPFFKNLWFFEKLREFNGF